MEQRHTIPAVGIATFGLVVVLCTAKGSELPDDCAKEVVCVVCASAVELLPPAVAESAVGELSAAVFDGVGSAGGV